MVGVGCGCVPAFGLRPVIKQLGLELLITPDLVWTVFAGTLALCLAAAMISFRKVASADPALVFRN